MLHQEGGALAVQDRRSRGWKVHPKVRENRRSSQGMHWKVKINQTLIFFFGFSIRLLRIFFLNFELHNLLLSSQKLP